MRARERWPSDAGPDAIPAFLRFVAVMMFAGLAVGAIRGALLVDAHGDVGAGLYRVAILRGTAEASRAVAWASVAALVAGVPALTYAVLFSRSFSPAATLLCVFPLHDLVRRATAADPAGLVGAFGPFLGSLPAESRHATAALLIAVAALLPLAAGMRRFVAARRSGAAAFIVLALTGALLPAALRAIASATARPRGPNVLLVTIDTLRADHMSAYGYTRPTSPNLDALAARGLLFERALTPCPRTTQAIASIMTSLYPQTHGVRSLWGRLEPARLTLSERFRDAGYATAGFWTTTFLDEKRGLSQGFEAYENTARESDRASHVTDRAILWLARTIGPRPDRGRADKRRRFFLWLHYRDPHMPYDPPPEDRVFVDPLYRGEFRNATVFWPTKEVMVYNHLGLIDSSDVRQAVALYDGEVRYVDKQIHRLLRDLDGRGLLDGTLVVVTSDHGEGLSDHGYYFDHGDLLFESSVQVPLIIAGPGVPAGRIRAPVGLTDLAPTITRMAGLSWPGNGEGRDLTSTIARTVGDTSAAGAAASAPRAETHALFFESGENLLGRFNPNRFVAGVEGKLRCVTDERWKLVMTPKPSGARALALYDLAWDPAETLNVIAAQPAAARALEKTLDTFLSADKESTGVDLLGIDAEDIEKLRSQGYMQ